MNLYWQNRLLPLKCYHGANFNLKCELNAKLQVELIQEVLSLASHHKALSVLCNTASLLLHLLCFHPCCMWCLKSVNLLFANKMMRIIPKRKTISILHPVKISCLNNSIPLRGPTENLLYLKLIFVIHTLFRAFQPEKYFMVKKIHVCLFHIT